MSEANGRKELTAADARECVKGGCQLSIVRAAFGGNYVACAKCRKSAGIKRTATEAVAEWNRWLEIGNGRL